MYPNRYKAGELLAKKLSFFKNNRRAIVVAIPNGGIMTAFPIAQALSLPLEIELVKKIQHPDNKELTLGAVSIYASKLHSKSIIPTSFFNEQIALYRELLKSKHALFFSNRAVRTLTNKTVLLVDDGIESGNTISLAIDLIRQQNPQRIILAVPIAPQKVLNKLEKKVDEIICLKYLLPGEHLKDHYRQFKWVKDITVIRLLRENDHSNLCETTQ